MKTKSCILIAVVAAAMSSMATAQTKPTFLTLRYSDDLPGESNFTRKNAWRTWNDQPVSIAAESGDGSVTLMFRTKLDADYTVTNDLGEPQTPFLLHGILLAQSPKLLGAKATVAHIAGKPLKLIANPAGDAPSITLGARDPKRAFATFDIAADIRFASILNIVGDGNQNFVISGHLAEEAAGLGITKSGTSTLQLAAENQWTGPTLVKGGTILLRSGKSLGAGALTIESSGIVQFESSGADAGLTTSLEIAEKGRLDLNGNGWVIDYTGESPLAPIQAMLHDGRIISSTLPEGGALVCQEASTVNLPSLGQRPVDATSVVIVIARAGDANLDGTVNGADLARVKATFDKPGTWVDGDFTQDGKVDLDDVLVISRSYDSKSAFDNDWNNLQP